MFPSGQNVKPTYCVLNKTRETFVSLNVTVANTPLMRLKGLLGKVRLRVDEGIWVVPSRGVHTIGVPFAIDLIYLDSDQHVILLIESFGSFRIGPVRRQCASVLELPTRSIFASQTKVGDELVIYTPNDMKKYLEEENNNALPQMSRE